MSNCMQNKIFLLKSLKYLLKSCLLDLNRKAGQHAGLRRELSAIKCAVELSLADRWEQRREQMHTLSD